MYVTFTVMAHRVLYINTQQKTNKIKYGTSLVGEGGRGFSDGDNMSLSLSLFHSQIGPANQLVR